MKFSFDESEIINSLLNNEIEIPNKKNFIKILINTKNSTEDQFLIDICNVVISKIKTIEESKYNSIVLNLPVETITNY